jgi:hypothetical protein
MIALLVGCAAAPRDPAKTEVAPGHGLLAARIVAHVPHLRIGLILTLRRLDRSGEVTLRSTHLPHARTAVFLEPLPPGRYRLDRVATFKGNAPLSSLPGEFDISANRVTDLGLIVLVFASLEQEPGFFITKTGRYVAVQERNARDTTAMLCALPPEVRARLRADEPLRPELQGNAQLNRRVLAAAKAHAGIVSQSALVPGQPVAFGRMLGQILAWDPGTEEGRAFDTGRSLNVLSVAFASDGSLLAGMEEGVVLWHRGGEWRELARPGGNGPVEFVGQAPSGEYFALVRDPEGFRLLSARDPQSAWSVARSFPVERAQAWLAAGKLVVIAWPRDLAPAGIHVFDPATRQWSQRDGTIDDRYEVLHDGSIVATSRGYRALHMRRSGGFGATEWRSTLMDETQNALFTDTTTVYRILLPQFGAERVQMIERSDDGGFTWARVGRVWRTGSGVWLSALPKPRWLLSSSPVGELSVSRDDGASWQPLKAGPE